MGCGIRSRRMAPKPWLLIVEKPQQLRPRRRRPVGRMMAIGCIKIDPTNVGGTEAYLI
jgi:hypothetical protein